jgi:hypothetical protein
VREALSFSAELHINKQANRRKQQQKSAEGGEEDEEEEDDDTTSDALSELRDLLKESDEMPVYMEEAVLLRCQLQALEWANKAALILPLTSSIPLPPALSATGAEFLDSLALDTGAGAAEGRLKARPRLAEVQRLAKEIKK